MSNSLTLSLAIVGGIILILLMIHNAWTTRKTAKTAVRMPLEDASPSSSSTPPIGADNEVAADTPAFSAMVSRRPTQRLDALIDAIAIIAIEQPLNGDYLNSQVPSSRRAGRKPMLTEGLCVDSGEWEPLQTGVFYSEVQVGVLLANRLGALNEIEYSEFVQKSQAFADAIGGSIELPDMLDVIARAKEIDAFAATHDAQIVMRLIARGSMWSVGFIQQHASKLGFVVGALPGRMVLPSQEEGAPPVLILQYDTQLALADNPEQAGLQQVLLMFDVPQTAQSEKPFERWSDAAQRLAQSMDADMVDDQGKVFLEQSFQIIHADLQHLYENLAQRDLAAGSAAARRLFS